MVRTHVLDQRGVSLVISDRISCGQNHAIVNTIFLDLPRWYGEPGGCSPGAFLVGLVRALAIHVLMVKPEGMFGEVELRRN
jgi:hypothetical protein